MKTSISIYVVLLITTLSAAAWNGPIRGPEYYMPAGCPRGAVDRVTKALSHPDCKFIEGRFFNLSASWQCGGNTFALNAFLKALSECPGVRMTITKVKDWRGKGDWSVYTHLNKDHLTFNIRINISSKRIVEKTIELPPLNGPPLSTLYQRLAFSERLKLSKDQERLLHPERSKDNERRDKPGFVGPNNAAIELRKKLSPYRNVRHARANELMIESGKPENVSVIINPTKENLVFHVAIKGEQVLRGSTDISVAHETWLPVGGRLFVTNMSWTTPAMKRLAK